MTPAKYGKTGSILFVQGDGKGWIWALATAGGQSIQPHHYHQTLPECWWHARWLPLELVVLWILKDPQDHVWFIYIHNNKTYFDISWHLSTLSQTHINTVSNVCCVKVWRSFSQNAESPAARKTSHWHVSEQVLFQNESMLLCAHALKLQSLSEPLVYYEHVENFLFWNTLLLM